jgi:hypothetical protein
LKWSLVIQGQQRILGVLSTAQQRDTMGDERFARRHATAVLSQVKHMAVTACQAAVKHADAVSCPPVAACLLLYACRSARYHREASAAAGWLLLQDARPSAACHTPPRWGPDTAAAAAEGGAQQLPETTIKKIAYALKHRLEMVVSEWLLDCAAEGRKVQEDLHKPDGDVRLLELPAVCSTQAPGATQLPVTQLQQTQTQVGAGGPCRCRTHQQSLSVGAMLLVLMSATTAALLVGRGCVGQAGMLNALWVHS